LKDTTILYGEKQKIQIQIPREIVEEITDEYVNIMGRIRPVSL